MPVAMTTSFKSGPGRTGLRSQDLPIIPTIQEMETWDKEKVLRWIQQRDSKILEGKNLDNFNKEDIAGRAFLRSSFRFFNKRCDLSHTASLGLKRLVDEVKKGGKFIPWT